MTHNGISSDVPPDVLEQRAIEQRRRMHQTVTELREQVRDTIHEKLDVNRYARDYVWPAAGIAGLLSLLIGYTTAGIFKRSA